MIRIGRPGWTWDPFREMDRFQQDISSLFSGVNRFPARTYPALNVYTGDEDVVITSEIPGIDPADIDLSVTGDMLTIKGTRKNPQLKNDERWHRRERGYGNFYRTLKLPYNVDGNKVSADYTRGVLKIVLPRAEADKPRKITVKAEK
ncbi:MAG: Hsp20/alpha crystallin family protein [Desulfomonilia bacterium]